MTEAEHAALPQQNVVAEANNDGDSHLAKDGVTQAGGKYQRCDGKHQCKH